MKKTICLLLSVLVFGPVLFAGAQQEQIVSRLNKELSPVIEEDMDRFTLPGLSISVVLDGQVIWAKGYGYADREKKIPATPDTVYRMGSISKLFNAVGIMMLTEQQKLFLDENIQKYLPEAHFENPFNEPSTITLRHILSHRSGIIRECSLGHYFDDTEPSIAETAASLYGTTLVYRPGTMTKYSNSAICLSGHILEKVSGMEFNRFQKRYVLKPLGMNSSGYIKNKSFEKRVAKGYMRDINGKQWLAPDFRFGCLPAANLYSNVIDMARFVDLICNDGKPLMEPETFRKTTDIQFQPDNVSKGFGLGFMVSRLHDELALEHNGAVYGFSSGMLVIPEKKLGVISLINLEGANGIDDKYIKYSISIALEELTGKKLLNIPKTVELPYSKLKEIAGKYKNDDQVIRMTLRDGKLYYESETPKQLLPVSESEFVTDSYYGHGEKISVLSEQGKVTGIKISNKEYTRTTEKSPDMNPAWNKLLGEYGPDFNVMEVYQKDGQLTVLIEWFYEYKLKHVEGLRFAFPAGLYHGEELRFIESDDKINEAQFSGVTFKRRN